MDVLDWIFFGPARLIGWWPYCGVLIGGLLIASQALLWSRDRKPFGREFFRAAPVFAGILWLIFNAFELQMSALAVQATKTGGSFLRMDLIVLVPILYVLSAAALLSLAKQLKSPR